MAEIIVKQGQSLYDIAVQYYGHVDGIQDLVTRNGLNGPLDNVYPGDSLQIGAPINERIVAFLAPHVVATLAPHERLDGIGWMKIASLNADVFQVNKP